MCTEDNEFYPTGAPGHAGAYAAGGLFDFLADTALPDDAVRAQLDQALKGMGILSLPGVLFDQVKDFAGSTVGKAFMTALGPGIFAELFTTAPGVGMYVTNALASLGPIAQNALPGLVRGERVDRALIASALDLASRLGPSAIGTQLPAASKYILDASKNYGFDPKALAAQADAARVASGLTQVDQELPTAARAQLDASLKPLLDKIGSIPQVLTAATQKTFKAQIDQLKAHAAAASTPERTVTLPGYNVPMKVGGRVSPAAIQIAIDAATRTSRYDPRNFTNAGEVRDVAAEDAAAAAKMKADADKAHANALAFIDAQAINAIDSFVLTPLGAKDVWTTQPNKALGWGAVGHWEKQGGKFQTANEIFASLQKDRGSYGGAFPKVPYGYVTDRIAYYAKLGRRPADPVVAFAEALARKAIGDLRTQAADKFAHASLLPPNVPAFAAQAAQLRSEGQAYFNQANALEKIENDTLASEKAAKMASAPVTQADFVTQGQSLIAQGSALLGIPSQAQHGAQLMMQGQAMLAKAGTMAVQSAVLDRFAERNKHVAHYLASPSVHAAGLAFHIAQGARAPGEHGIDINVGQSVEECEFYPMGYGG